MSVERADRRATRPTVVPLLDLVQRQALDEDYAVVAARRRANGPDGGVRRRDPRAWPGVLVMITIGTLLAVAIDQTSEQAVTSQAGRSTLITRIEENRVTLSRVQQRIGNLKARNAAISASLTELDDDVTGLEGELTRLGVPTGATPVRGEGVRIRVNDSPSGLEAEMVRDEDLALLVDGLWRAGAEAVAINGQRIAALTYIRNSGPTIFVNAVPLAPPYVVEAIGDTRTLQAGLLQSAAGSRFADLARLLDFEFTRQNVEDLRLPGARIRPLRTVQVGDGMPNPVNEGGTP